MKLINSDVFKEKLNYLNYELYNSHPIGELSKEEKDTVSWYIHHISQMVDNMTIVKAIPIDWIPEKMIPEMVIGNHYAEGCVKGWNDCIDAIMEERK